MGKRAANGYRAMIDRLLGRSPVARAAASLQRRHSESNQGLAAPEPLEQRVMLSTTAVTVQWDGKSVSAVPNEYVVYTTNTRGLEKIAAKEDFTDVQSLGAAGYYQFTTSLSTAQVQALTAKFPAVMGETHPNAVGSVASVSSNAVTPNDAYFPQQYALDNTGQLETYDYNEDGVIESYENQYGTPGADIDATQAWEVTTGSKNVVVAVLDTGVDLNNPDLAGNIWTNPNPNSQSGFPDDIHGWNFVSNDNDVTDDNGHGTNVAGIIGAEGNNSIGITGINWNVSILPVKVGDADGELTDAAIVAGINYVNMLKSQGVNIVVMNMSFGGTGADPVTLAALQQSQKLGVLASVAAGNDNENLDQAQTFPAKFVLATSNIITVAAVDNQGKLASFSNYGAGSVEVAAPGVNILSTAPTYTVEEPPTPLDPTQTNPALVPYGFESGTSQATPQVTGIIALEAAANPSATPAELKTALLDGVRIDPNLESVNGLPPLVATSGEVDAYTAVLNVQNYATGTNTTRHGNWVSFYGTEGAYVVGDSTTFPSFVTGSFTGGTPVVLQDPSNNAAALLQATSPTQRIEAYEASATSETINLDFTDGASHQVALYLADANRQNRVELVQLIDANTGTVLSSQTVSKFTGGEYLVYNLQGNVQITLTNLRSTGTAVFSGIFFDAVPTSPISFVSSDTTTKGGSWRSTYGAAGDIIAGDNNTGTIPAYVESFAVDTTSNGATVPASITTLSSSTNNATALNKNQDIYHNIAAFWTAPATFDVDIDFSDTQLHQVTLYAADYNQKKRSERIEVIDATTGAILNVQDLANFVKGEFVTFNVSGDVIFRVINMGGPSAVLSGIFFDNPPGENGSFQGVNSTLEGNWLPATFASVNQFVVGDNFPNVDDFGLTTPIIDSVTGASERVLSENTNNPSALLRPEDTFERIASYIYSNTSMTLNINFDDNSQHELALYFADYEHLRRSEFVTIIDSTTGQVLANQRVFNFNKGEYLVYNITGPVTVIITNAGYPNAVLSGIFTT